MNTPKRIHNLIYCEHSRQWVCVMRNSGVGENNVTAPNLQKLWELVGGQYKSGKRLHCITFGENSWVAVMKKEPMISEQAIVASKLSSLWQKLQDQYNKDRRMHYLTFSQNNWIAIVRKFKQIHAEQAIVGNTLGQLWQKVEIEYSKNKRIQCIAYSDVEKIWVAVMKEFPYLASEQAIVAQSVDALWGKMIIEHSKGRRLANLSYGNGTWVAVMKEMKEEIIFGEQLVIANDMNSLWLQIDKAYSGSTHPSNYPLLLADDSLLTKPMINPSMIVPAPNMAFNPLFPEPPPNLNQILPQSQYKPPIINPLTPNEVMNKHDHPMEVEDEDESKYCKVCFERPVNTVLLECAHSCLCEECSKSVMDSTKECPICRQTILRVIKIFKS